jgi:uncharacterized protein (DUF2147 family)
MAEPHTHILRNAPTREKVVRSAFFLGLVLLAVCAHADSDSPVGAWRTIDDKTGKQRSVIRISESAGVLEGKVEEIFAQPGDDPKHLCKACEGERKGKPVIGMTILWGLKKEGNGYTGGEILDPDSGAIYRAKAKLLDGGNKLEVRGYIGVSLFGRSQTWIRQ